MDFMGEIILALTGVPAVAHAANQGAQRQAVLRYLLLQLLRIDALLRQQAQPLARQGGAPFRRMDAWRPW